MKQEEVDLGFEREEERMRDRGQRAFGLSEKRRVRALGLSEKRRSAEEGRTEEEIERRRRRREGGGVRFGQRRWCYSYEKRRV